MSDGDLPQLDALSVAERGVGLSSARWVQFPVGARRSFTRLRSEASPILRRFESASACRERSGILPRHAATGCFGRGLRAAKTRLAWASSGSHAPFSLSCRESFHPSSPGAFPRPPLCGESQDAQRTSSVASGFPAARGSRRSLRATGSFLAHVAGGSTKCSAPAEDSVAWRVFPTALEPNAHPNKRRTRALQRTAGPAGRRPRSAPTSPGSVTGRASAFAHARPAPSPRAERSAIAASRPAVSELSR